MQRSLAPGFQAIHDECGIVPSDHEMLCELRTVTLDMDSIGQSTSKTIPLTLRKRIRAIQYCILSGEECYDMADPAVQRLKACRLGVLLYVGIIQHDFWVSPISRQMKDHLQSCLGSQSFATAPTQALHLWLLFLAGSVDVDAVERPWYAFAIAQAAVQLSLLEWCDVKPLLKTFAWADKIQDKSGRELWDEATKCNASGATAQSLLL